MRQDEFESIIGILPVRDRIAMREQELSPEWLQENIARCNRLMKKDLWVGLIWFALYSISLFLTKFGKLTIGIFVIGLVYFTYVVFKTGSFGLNKKRIRVYEQLLEKLKN